MTLYRQEAVTWLEILWMSSTRQIPPIQQTAQMQTKTAARMQARTQVRTAARIAAKTAVRMQARIAAGMQVRMQARTAARILQTVTNLVIWQGPVLYGLVSFYLIFTVLFR